MASQLQVNKRCVSGASRTSPMSHTSHTLPKLRLCHWLHAVGVVLVLVTLGMPSVYASEEAASEDAPTTQPASEPATTQPAAKAAATQEAVVKPEAATPEFLEKLQDDLRKVNSVQSNFKQTKHLAIFEHEVIIRGQFALAKPDRLIWIVNSPVKYAVRLIGSEIRQWDEDTGKVQTMQMDGDAGFEAASDQLKAWFLGDFGMLTKTFDITIKNKKPLTLVFMPKTDGMAGEFLKRVELTFGESRLHIQKFIAIEPGGDVTTIDFIDTRINEPVKDSVWDMPPHE